MAYDPTELYPVIAQIAAAFAGFGSLATGLGQRRGGDDARVDAYRLGLMLQASLSATLLGLLPATLAGLRVGDHWSIRASALAGLIAIGCFLPAGIKGWRKIWDVAGFSRGATIANGACIATATVAFALSALGVSTAGPAGVYLLALMALLGGSVVMFSRVIASMLRPHSRGEHPAS